MNRILTIFAIFLATGSITRAQEDAPVDPEVLRAEEMRTMEEDTRSIPVVGPTSVSDIIQFTVEQDRLYASTNLKATDGRSRIDVKELPGIATVSVYPDPTAGEEAPPRAIDLQHHSFNSPDAIRVITMVFAGGNSLQISRSTDGIKDDLSVQLIQNETAYDVSMLEGEYGIRLYVQLTDDITGEQKVNLNLHAANFRELRRKYPRETNQYLQPIFRDLKQDHVVFAVDARAAWQVFAPNMQPEPALVETIQQIVAQFEADDFKARTSAMSRLEALGQPAAIALLSMPREGWSEEQISRVDTFLAAYRPLSREETEQLATDPGFLLDCLASDDADIRAQALKALRKSVDKPIAFDLDAADDIRAAAIAKLRAELLAAPATQPAAVPGL